MLHVKNNLNCLLLTNFIYSSQNMYNNVMYSMFIIIYILFSIISWTGLMLFIFSKVLWTHTHSCGHVMGHPKLNFIQRGEWMLHHNREVADSDPIIEVFSYWIFHYYSMKHLNHNEMCRISYENASCMRFGNLLGSLQRTRAFRLCFFFFNYLVFACKPK